MFTDNSGNVKAHEILNDKDNKKKDTFVFVETEDGHCVLLDLERNSCEDIKRFYGFRDDAIVHKVELTPKSREIMMAIYCTLGNDSDDIVTTLEEFANEVFKIGLSARGKAAI